MGHALLNASTSLGAAIPISFNVGDVRYVCFFFLEATALSPSFLLRLMKVVEEPSKFDLLN